MTSNQPKGTCCTECCSDWQKNAHKKGQCHCKNPNCPNCHTATKESAEGEGWAKRFDELWDTEVFANGTSQYYRYSYQKQVIENFIRVELSQRDRHHQAELSQAEARGAERVIAEIKTALGDEDPDDYPLNKDQEEYLIAKGWNGCRADVLYQLDKLSNK